MSANSRLKKAIIKQDLEGARTALTKDVQINIRFRKGTRPYTRLIHIFSIAGAGVAASGLQYNSFIGLCLQKGTPEILKALLENKANPNIKIDIANSTCKGAQDWTTPLLYTIHNNQTDFLRVLLESNKVDPFLSVISSEFIGYKKISPLDYAKEKGNPEIINMLDHYISNYEENQKQIKIEDTPKTGLDTRKFATVWNPIKGQKP